MSAMDSAFSFFAIIPILLWLFLVGFSIYFVIRTLRFMKEKTALDQERNHKLDQLIQALRTNKEA